MKAILLSVNPEQVANIFNGKQTIIIRKTMPRCELPIKVYVYCTKDGYLHLEDEGHWSYSRDQKYTYKRHGKVVAYFTLRKAERCINPYFPKCSFATKTILYEELLSKSCLTEEGFCEYINKGSRGYVWYVSDLVIFNKPKELSNFGVIVETIHYRAYQAIKRPPRSWRYVEELE